MGAASRGEGEFNPITSIAWHTAFWAEGTEFVALGLSDTDPVSTWPDEISTNDATQATASKRPLYRSSVTALNNRPAVDFDGVNDLLSSPSFTTVSEPFTVAVVVNLQDVTTNAERIVDLAFEDLGGATPHVTFGSNAGGPTWFLFQGGSSTGGTASTGGHLIIANFDSGANDFLEVDGSTVISASNVGSNSARRVTIGSLISETVATDGDIAFVGFLDGALTAQQKSDLLDWSQTLYGTP